ncbi:hypothetical protein H9K75_03195 [Diaphorobacter aerolatus]|uniref:Uncharacterized protein n=1 Tax=Diaphorobacter aerolatus TaxID=1288495 RepID=A0A7H0GLI3_9BURK|nr:hypothetical protein H9K75_03195 [Diaphorobacter aerolatus]
MGAGDAFSAAYVAAIAQGLSVPRAMRNAHRCAAHMVGGAGVLARLADGRALAAWAAANDLPAVRGVPSA